jgi:hypothetical protein
MLYKILCVFLRWSRRRKKKKKMVMLWTEIGVRA